jgi:hypothetical protein
MCGRQELSNPAFLSYFQIKELLILFCSGVSNSNSESENHRFRLFYGIPVITSSGLLPFVDNRPHTGVWRLPKFKPQYFSSWDLDRIWRPRSSWARSAWTPDPVSENHLGPVGVQTNGATCQVVTELAKVTKIAELRDKLSEINVLRLG